MYDHAAWAVEHRFAHDYAATYRKTMHEATVIPCVVEPWHIDTPMFEFVPKVEVAIFVTVMPGR
jgi:hypothetical protein